MNKYERVNKIAMIMDMRYKELKQQRIRFTMIYDKLNTELISLTHKFYYNELSLKENHPWGYDYNMGDNGGVYDDINKSISLNYELIRPVDYLFAGLDEQDEEKKEQYYDIAIQLLSSVVHELRHAWQDEMGILVGLTYVTAEEDFEKYQSQEVEIDAKSYQSKFFTEEYFKFVLNNYK